MVPIYCKRELREEKRNIMAIPAKIIVSGVEPFNLPIPRIKRKKSEQK